MHVPYTDRYLSNTGNYVGWSNTAPDYYGPSEPPDYSTLVLEMRQQNELRADDNYNANKTDVGVDNLVGISGVLPSYEEAVNTPAHERF